VVAGKGEVSMGQVARALKCFKEAHQPLTKLEQLLPKLRGGSDFEVEEGVCEYYQTELDIVRDAIDIGTCTCEAQQVYRAPPPPFFSYLHLHLEVSQFSSTWKRGGGRSRGERSEG